jgi:hypothetical protein
MRAGAELGRGDDERIPPREAKTILNHECEPVEFSIRNDDGPTQKPANVSSGYCLLKVWPESCGRGDVVLI